MAKKTKKAPKLPKEIAGIKLSKKVRKAGGELLARANSPAGREVLALGLTAAGAALARKNKALDPKTGEKLAGTAPVDPADLGARVAAEIGTVVTAAASAALDRWLHPAKTDENKTAH